MLFPQVHRLHQLLCLHCCVCIILTRGRVLVLGRRRLCSGFLPIFAADCITWSRAWSSEYDLLPRDKIVCEVLVSPAALGLTAPVSTPGRIDHRCQSLPEFPPRLRLWPLHAVLFGEQMFDSRWVCSFMWLYLKNKATGAVKVWIKDQVGWET